MPAWALASTRSHARVAFCFAASALLGSLPATAAAASTTVALRAQAEVDAPTVVVADLLVLLANTSASNHRLAAQPLWAAPAPCRSVAVSPAEIAARLRELRIDVELTGPGATETVVIHRTCHRVESGALQAVARQSLALWLAGRAERFVIDPADAQSTPIELPGRGAVLVARPLEADRALASRMQVWVDAIDGERVVRAIPVTFSVRAYGQAWVASRDAHVDQPAQGAGLERREVDLAGVHGRAAMADLADVRLRRPLLAGDVLTLAHLGSDGVRSGTQVTARSHVGAVGIEATAQALQDGRAGQTVWVRVAGATAAVRARVIDKSSVEVERE